MLICYPNKALMLGKSSYFFAAMPGKDRPFQLTAHMRSGPHEVPEDGYYSSHTTMAQDGTTVMDDAGLVNFHARGLLNWAHFVMEQLPPHLRVEIDPEAFLGAFSYRAGDRRVGLKSWNLAPSADVNHPFEERHVTAQSDVLDLLYNRMSKGIPELSTNPFKPNYLTDRGHKIRPMCTSA